MSGAANRTMCDENEATDHEYIVTPLKDKNGIWIGHEHHGEVIRCKECRYWSSDVPKLCYIWSRHGCMVLTDPDEYCSNGRRCKE